MVILLGENMRNTSSRRIILAILMLIIACSLTSCEWLLSNWFDKDTKAVIIVTNEDSTIESYVSRMVFINGGDSICGASDTLTYEWSLETPSGSSTLLEEVVDGSESIESKRQFTPDIPGIYKVNLYIEDDDEDSNSSDKIINVKDKPQSAPTNLNLKSAEVDNITVEWEAVADTTQYLLFRAMNTLGPFNLKVYEGPLLEYTDNTVAPGTTYYYKVQAKNPAGMSNLSSYIESTTKLAVPANFQTTGNTTTSASLSWDNSQNATSYIVEKSLIEDGSYIEAFSGNAT